MAIVIAFGVPRANALSKQEKAVRGVEAQVEWLRKAMIDGDGAKLKDLTSRDLSYGHSGGHVEGQTEFIQKIVSGESDFVVMNFTDQTVSIVNGIAIVRHTLIAKTNNRGEPGEVTIGVMLIWAKHRGQWKLLARQAFKPH